MPRTGTLILSYPDILSATVGLGLMRLAGVISIRAIRRRVRREVWWTVHLYLYLALAVGGDDALEAVGALDGYAGYLIRPDGSEAYTGGIEVLSR